MFLGGINKMSLSELSFWQRTDNESSISEAGYRTSSYYYSQSVPYQSFFEDLMKNSRGQELQDWEILGKPLISLTFSDLLVTRNGIPTIFQSVNNQLSVWQVSDTLNRTWEKKGTYPLTIEDYFTSFEVAGKLYIVQPDGRIYQVTDATLIEVTRLPEKLRMGTLLINKDTEEVYYLGQRALSMIGKIPIPEIMVTEAVKINVF